MIIRNILGNPNTNDSLVDCRICQQLREMVVIRPAKLILNHDDMLFISHNVGNNIAAKIRPSAFTTGVLDSNFKVLC